MFDNGLIKSLKTITNFNNSLQKFFSKNNKSITLNLKGSFLFYATILQNNDGAIHSNYARKWIINDICIISVTVRVAWNGLVIVRSSRPEVFCKKDVLKNFAKFTGKHLWPETCNFITKETSESLEIPKILRTPFFMEQLWWLLLKGNYWIFE